MGKIKPLVPKAFKAVSDPKSGAKFLNETGLGIDKNFVNQQFNKFSPYMSMIPGMSADVARPMVDALTGEMNSNSTQTTQTPTDNIKFNKNKYPKL